MRPEQLSGGGSSRGQLALPASCRLCPATSAPTWETLQPWGSLCNLPPRRNGASLLGGIRQRIAH